MTFFNSSSIYSSSFLFPQTDPFSDRYTDNVFLDLSHTPPPYSPEGSYDEYHQYSPCPGATSSNAVNRLFDTQRSSWVLDTSRFSHKPPEMFINGQLIGLQQALPDGEHILRVLGVEMVGNGDAEKNFDYFGFFNEEKWGNIYFLLSPDEVCQNWSPPIPAVPVDSFRKAMTNLDGYEEQTGWERKKRDCPNKKEGLNSTAVLSAPLPGPFLSKYPFLTDLGSRIAGKPLGEKCEFGLLWQSVLYEKTYPLLDLDDWTLPTPWRDTQMYCGRLMEADSGPYDTILMQFFFSIPEILHNGGVMVYAHNAEDPDFVHRGPIVSAPSLVKIALAYGKLESTY